LIISAEKKKYMESPLLSNNSASASPETGEFDGPVAGPHGLGTGEAEPGRDKYLRAGKVKTPAGITGQGFVGQRLLFCGTGAAAAGGFFLLLLLHGSGFSAFRTFFRFASAFLRCTTFFTFKNSHFALLLGNFEVLP
jgi:hypothetical protein